VKLSDQVLNIFDKMVSWERIHSTVVEFNEANLSQNQN
jgi:hypothetical protein